MENNIPCLFISSIQQSRDEGPSLDTTSASTSLAIVPYVPRIEYVGTTPAGFYPVPPAPHQHEEQDEGEEMPDMVEAEDDVAPQGSGFVYDENIVNELLQDRYGTLRAQTEDKKKELIGTSTTVRGQEWVVRDDIGVDDIYNQDFIEQGLRSNLIDCGTLPKKMRSRDECLRGVRASPRTPKVERNENKAIHDTFMTLFPVNWKQSLKRLNAAISADPGATTRRSNSVVSEHDYFIFIGILLLAGVQSSGGIEALYKKKQTEGMVKKVKASEHMSYTRFKFIKSYWVRQFEIQMDDEEKERNLWWRMHYLITGFNNNRRNTVASSRVLTLDESMSAFRPQLSKTGNLPNISFILRKPENLGTELKAVASTTCNGPIIHLEVQEGKNAMKRKEYYSTYGVTTACVLRMAQATKACGNKPDPMVTNLFYGDSWFSSLKTAVAVKKELNSEYIGVIKTSHKHYPKQYLETTMKEWPPGSHLVLQTHKDGETFYAIGYKYNMRKVLFFITTEGAGSTMPGTPYEAKWLDENGRIASRQIPRPHLISEYYKNSNQIDKHNHARQGVLALEKNVVTQCGYFRLFTTYLGITVTDAWKLYRHGLGDKHENKEISIVDFTNILCKTHLLNQYKRRINEKNPMPTLPLLTDNPDARKEITFSSSIVASVSTLGSPNIAGSVQIGPGKYIPAAFVAAHSTAFCKPTEEYIACKGAYSNRRRKRNKCKVCQKNTSQQCTMCLEWICAASKSNCFVTHQTQKIHHERNAYWETLQA